MLSTQKQKMTDPNYPKVETIEAIDADEGCGFKS